MSIPVIVCCLSPFVLMALFLLAAFLDQEKCKCRAVRLPYTPFGPGPYFDGRVLHETGGCR